MFIPISSSTRTDCIRSGYVCIRIPPPGTSFPRIFRYALYGDWKQIRLCCCSNDESAQGCTLTSGGGLREWFTD